MGDVDARSLFEHFARQVLCGADPTGAKIDRIGVVFGDFDEVGDASNGTRGLNEQDQGRLHQFDDRNKVFTRVVGQFAVEQWIDRNDGVGGKENAVAIGSRSCHIRCGQIAASAVDVLAHDRLAPLLGQSLRQNTRDSV